MNQKIAIITPDFPPTGAGGIVTAHFGMYKSFVAQGFHTKAFTYFNERPKKGAPVNTHELPDDVPANVVRVGPPKLFRNSVKVVSYSWFRTLDRCRLAYQTSDILQSTWGALQLNGAIRAFDPDVIILPDQGCPGLLIDKPKPECRMVLVSHHNPSRFLENRSFGVHSKRDASVALDVENRVLKKIDRVICPSDHMARKFQSTYTYKGPISVIPNFVDHEQIEKVQRTDLHELLSLPPEAPIIYIPSAGSDLKGANYLFEIICRLAGRYPGELGFYLSGPMHTEFRERLGWTPSNARLHAPGHVDYDTNISYMKGCTFGISPTMIESFGMSLLEASFCGVPMISFDIDAVPEVLIEEKNGYVVRFRDLDQLGDRAFALMTDRDLLAKMSQSSRKFAYEHFSRDVIFDKLRDFVLGDSPQSGIH